MTGFSPFSPLSGAGEERTNSERVIVDQDLIIDD